MIIQLDRTAFKRRIWHRAFHRMAKSYPEKIAKAANWHEKDKLVQEGLEKYVFYGIKCYGTWSENTSKQFKIMDDEALYSEFEEFSELMNHMKLFTPRQFMQLFPIKKEYDGEKWSSKDYFYTMNYINEIGIDQSIEEPFAFLWDYWNRETSRFLMNYMSIMSELRKRDTGMGIAEEFCRDNGIEIFYKEDL